MENHISSLKWTQIFSIHELSSLWFLNRSTIYLLSFVFTLSITIDSLHLIYQVYTCEYIFSFLPLCTFIFCVSFPETCHSATAGGILWASFHSFFLINLIWLVGWTIASHSIAQIYSWKKIKRHRSKITSTSQKPLLQGQIFPERSSSLPFFSPSSLLLSKERRWTIAIWKMLVMQGIVLFLCVFWSLMIRATLRLMSM